jgi:hypothetical protein
MKRDPPSTTEGNLTLARGRRWTPWSQTYTLARGVKGAGYYISPPYMTLNPL